ncbi:hypothetical protein [Mycobacterium sp. URHB0021]
MATALTPIAFFETVMVRRCENLVDSDTRVDVNTGIVAAGRLQSLIDSRDRRPRSVGDEGQVTRSSSHCRRRCGWRSSRSWNKHPEALDVGADSFNDADDEPFDPTEFLDEDDEF